MPTIVFEGNGKCVEAREGGALVDIFDEALAPVPFSCRSATCGTCRVEVIQGASLLEQPSARERELLATLGASDRDRLGCQARVRPGAGLVRLRAAGSRACAAE